MLCVSDQLCVFVVRQQKQGKKIYKRLYIYIYLYMSISSEPGEVVPSLHTSLPLGRHQTMVQMVLRLGSKRTTFPSAAFVLVLYMGFSNVACPLLFSWTEHPVYCALSVFLWKGGVKKMRWRISSETVSVTLLPSQ